MEQGTPLDGFSRSAAEGIPQLACSVPFSKETSTDTNSVKIKFILLRSILIRPFNIILFSTVGLLSCERLAMSEMNPHVLCCIFVSLYHQPAQNPQFVTSQSADRFYA
jgi:hypothetical protein